MDVQCIGFIFHQEKPETVNAIRSLVNIAANQGICCAVDQGDLSLFGEDVLELSHVKPDFFVAAGGDGTILRSAVLAARAGVPVLGVNFGRIGFLSEIGAAQFAQALRQIRQGEFFLDRRLMLRCEMPDKICDLCLNDFTLYKHSFEGVAHIAMRIGGLDAGSVFADGLILSTPTGATGYSISAGGPIVAPGHETSIIAPICPHTLHARPIVCAPDAVLEFTMLSDGLLSADGRQIAELHRGDVVHVSQADCVIEFIRFEISNLYELIRKKLS